MPWNSQKSSNLTKSEKTHFQKCNRNLFCENIFWWKVFYHIINMLRQLGIQYRDLESFLDGREKIQTRLRGKNKIIENSLESTSTIPEKSWFSRNSSIFGGLYLRAQEELEVRTTCVVKAWMRSLRKIKHVSKIFSQKKVLFGFWLP